MEESEKVWIATVAISKSLTYEQLKYSDYLNGKESFIDDVWEFVKECKEIGADDFVEKYGHYKLYAM
jgi:hypothetical protein